MAEHSVLSPSSAHRWMRCPGSINLEAKVPDVTSSYAAEGSAAHELAAKCLTLNADAKAVIGEVITIDGMDFEITPDMAGHVNDYCKLVREYVMDGQLLVERRVDFSSYVGVANSSGTSDAIILRGSTLVVIDLKYGMGVRVDAERNEQMMLYALGAVNDYGMLGDFDNVVMVVHQPRLNHVSEFHISIADLLDFAEDACLAAVEALEHEAPRLEPGEKQCRFCRAKATCPALADEIKSATGAVATVADFADLAQLEPDDIARAMSRVELVEQWCKAIRGEVELRLLNNIPVPGFKLVEGRKGNRSWKNEDEVEALFKTFRLKKEQMYDLKLISPTSAEKILKKKYPGRWDKAEALISRSDGKPSVASATDKRPALVVSNVADELRRIAAD
jgi:hypothetical protein